MLVLVVTSEILMIAAASVVVAVRPKVDRMARVAVACGLLAAAAAAAAVIAAVRRPVVAVVVDIVAVVRAAVHRAPAAINAATKLVHRHRPQHLLRCRWNG